MEIPAGGGILWVWAVSGEPAENRANTVQYWLTEKELWEITTRGTVPTVSQVDYPTGEPTAAVQSLLMSMRGTGGGTSFSISAFELQLLRSGRNRAREGLNGELRTTAAGIPYVVPNAAADVQ